MTFLEMKEEMGRLRMSIREDDRTRLKELEGRWETTRTASYHRPHGCLVLPCAKCRGEFNYRGNS